jgi:hypothetical protein
MTIKEQQLEAAKNAVGSVLHNTRCAYTNGMALRQLYTEKEKHFLFNLSEHSAPEVLRIPNCLSHINNIATTSLGSNFGTLKILLDLSEASAEFQEAYSILQPMVDRVAELEAEIQAETETASRALHALHEAEDAARQAAESKAMRDPAVIAARKALEDSQPALVPEAAEPAPLIRGRQKLETVPA